MELRFGGGHFCRVVVVVVVVVLGGADVTIRGVLYLQLYYALCSSVLVIQAISLAPVDVVTSLLLTCL
jgi:hypothetical protein